MATIWFGLLGPLEVRADRRRIRLSGPRQERALATLLIDVDRAVTIDSLVDTVWERPPATARRQVQDLVTRLRRTLLEAGASADVITTHRGGYRLRPGVGNLDTQEFEHLVAAAGTAVEPASAARLYRQALALWRGEPLAGLDSLRLGATALMWRERQVTVWEKCLARELASESYQDALTDLLRLVEQHPLRESLVALLMRALHDSGRRADALHSYRRLRERLAEELGLDPAPELTNLHALLLRGDDPLVVTGPSAQPERVPAQLPLDVLGFTGRERELAQLDAHLCDAAGQATATLVTVLCGTAGVGKSALAVHWAHRVRARFPGGQLHLNLRGFDPSGSAMAPADALLSMLGALGMQSDRIPEDLQRRGDLYRSLLATQRVLIVLDNARDAEQVRPLLPGSPGSMVLITSRDHLAGLIAGAGARPVAVDLLTAAQARTLLARRLGAARAAGEPAAVDAIIRRCVRLPLALTLVAARAATRPTVALASIADELATADAVLDVFDGAEPALQLRAVLSWSYQALDESTARLFRLIALHPGPDLTAPAAAALADVPGATARALLYNLCRAHLLTEHTSGRYAYHDLLRSYAEELADRYDGEADRRASFDRLLAHYLCSADAAAALIAPGRDRISVAVGGTAHAIAFGDQQRALAWFTAEHENLLAAIRHPAGARSPGACWQLAWAMSPYLDRTGRWHDWAAVHVVALSAARQSADLLGQAHALRGLGRAYAALGREEEAAGHLRHGLALFREVGNEPEQAQIWMDLAKIDEQRGHYSSAMAHSRRGLELFEAAGHRVGQANALNIVGWHFGLMGQYRQAVEYCSKALSLLQELGDHRGEAATWDSLGFAHQHLGSAEMASRCYRRAIELFQATGDRHGAADALEHLGDSCHHAEDDLGAHTAWTAAHDILLELGHADAARVGRKLKPDPGPNAAD